MAVRRSLLLELVRGEFTWPLPWNRCFRGKECCLFIKDRMLGRYCDFQFLSAWISRLIALLSGSKRTSIIVCPDVPPCEW